MKPEILLLLQCFRYVIFVVTFVWVQFSLHTSSAFCSRGVCVCVYVSNNFLWFPLFVIKEAAYIMFV